MEAGLFTFESAARKERKTRPIAAGVRLVVIEDVSAGLRGPAAPDGGDQTVIIARGNSERPADLAMRARRKIRSIEQSGHAVEVAIVVLQPRFDAEVTAARLAFARALMVHAARTPGRRSELLLSTASCPQLAEVQRGLSALVDAVVGEPANWSLPVHVHRHLACELTSARPLAKRRAQSDLTVPERTGLGRAGMASAGRHSPLRIDISQDRESRRV